MPPGPNLNRRGALMVAVLVAVSLPAVFPSTAPAKKAPSAHAAMHCGVPIVGPDPCEAASGIAHGVGKIVHGHVGEGISQVATSGCSAVPLGKPTCNTAKGVGKTAKDIINGHPGKAAVDLVTAPVGGADAITAGLTGWVADGVAKLLRSIGTEAARTSSPRLTATWFRGQYLKMMEIAALLAVPLLLLMVVQALVYQAPAMILTGVGRTLVAFVLCGAAVVLVQLLVGATDELSARVAASTGADLKAWFAHLAHVMVGLGGIAGLFLVFLIGLITAIAGLAVWIELLIREAGIYIVAFFLPVTLVAMIWPATSRWARRGVELLVAVIFAKFLIVGIIALGAAAAGQSGSQVSMNAMLVGTGILVLAAFAPFTVLALVPHAEHALSVTRGRGGHAQGLADGVVSRGSQVAMLTSTGGTAAAASSLRPVVEPAASGPRPGAASAPASAGASGTQTSSGSGTLPAATQLPAASGASAPASAAAAPPQRSESTPSSATATAAGGGESWRGDAAATSDPRAAAPASSGAVPATASSGADGDRGLDRPPVQPAAGPAPAAPAGSGHDALASAPEASTPGRAPGEPPVPGPQAAAPRQRPAAEAPPSDPAINPPPPTTAPEESDDA